MVTHPKHLPADARRAETVDTFIRLAAAQNPGDITTAALAQNMGLTQGALFRHFPSKDAILEAVMDRVAKALLSRIDRAASQHASPLAAMEAMFLAHAGFVAEHPGVPRMLFGELQRAERTPAKQLAQSLIKRYGERLHQLIRSGQDSGEISRKVEADAAATLFIGMIQGLVMQSLLAGDTSRLSRDATRVFVIYRQGIGAST